MPAPTDSAYYDIDGNLVDAVDKALEASGVLSIEQQRSELREGHRAEVRATLLGETETTAINPHTNEIFYSEKTIALNIDLRTPSDQYLAHREARGRIRALLAYPRGLCTLKAHLPWYTLTNIMMGETIPTLQENEENQNELSSDMAYTLTLHLNPKDIPA